MEKQHGSSGVHIVVTQDSETGLKHQQLLFGVIC